MFHHVIGRVHYSSNVSCSFSTCNVYEWDTQKPRECTEYVYYLCTELLGVISNVTISFIMSVHLLWHNLAPTGWIFMKFDNCFLKICYNN